MRVKIKKLHPDAVIPQYATSGSACFDLSSVGSAAHPADPVAVVFDTGLAFEIPQDHVMLVFSRSGHGFRSALRLSNCVGVVDADYRGSVQVSLRCDSVSALPKTAPPLGERIAQALILPVQQVSFLEVDELGATERGTGGLGSTGSGSLASQEDADWGPWVTWAGGANPLSEERIVQVKTRNCRGPFEARSSQFHWEHWGDRNDIVTFRVKKGA